MTSPSSSSPSRSLRPRKPKIEKIREEEDELRESFKASKKRKTTKPKETKSSTEVKKVKRDVIDTECCFEGQPVPDEEARNKWPDHYRVQSELRLGEGEEDEHLVAECHYLEAKIDGICYNLGDDVSVEAAEGEQYYIGRITEFFKTVDDRLFFTTLWFYRAKDTVIGNEHAKLVKEKRVFISDIKNDNPLDCIISKLTITRVPPNINLLDKEAILPPCDFYYDMKYSLAFSEFSDLPKEITSAGSRTSSTISSDACSEGMVVCSKSGADIKTKSVTKQTSPSKVPESEMTLLDLYSGCGAMSTGLCLGAKDVNLVTRWALDLNKFACQSLKLNHPETKVINESAENFLTLLKEWKKLCQKFSLLGTSRSKNHNSHLIADEDDLAQEDKTLSEELEVQKLVDIMYGDPYHKKEFGLYFKVRWDGYNSSEDTWEPIHGLRNCQERIKEFVIRGYESNILPLPGDVDVICGGPPCQGVSGFNRHRNKEAPLDDPRNQQLVVFMDIVEYLRPRYVLMENVADILKFADGFLGCYAVGRLVSLDYQTRLGMMVAGCYGLPQFRMRVFLWGARRTEILPGYPLPTHEVVIRGQIPNKFERNVVAYEEGCTLKLERAILLGDALSDLPPVTNNESRDEISYLKPAQTEFQKYIRLSREELYGKKDSTKTQASEALLYDHRPLKLNQDDYERVCLIPKKKGANFRDLPGTKVGPNNKIEWDKSVEQVLLESGKSAVPDYAMSFCRGTSPKPFGRLWWDEIVPTVVTRAEPHNQIIVHPEQDRVLSVRENARIQGFPDCYKLCGPIKERYTQVGNAVAVPVARVLGYGLSLACQVLHEVKCSQWESQYGYVLTETKDNTLFPATSPSAEPQPFLPVLSPPTSTPFTNNSVPRLSGLCSLNFSTVESTIYTTANDCLKVFAPYLANVICCPQLEATVSILIGQSSKYTGNLALDRTHATHCLSDLEKILAGQGAASNLQQICSINPSSLTESSCPVKDVNEFEGSIDVPQLLAACQRIDPVNECCSHICQNAISEAAKKIASKDNGMSSKDGVQVLSEHLSRVDDCKSIVLRWIASKLDPAPAKKVLRGLSNCKLNKACPLKLPDIKSVTKDCASGVSNKTSCCGAMENYVSHLQNQSFVTNLQALDCAAMFGRRLQKANITENVYNICHISLKDFSVQVGPQESGCLLPSLPTDVSLTESGVSFLCDLNDNIAAPWPSKDQSPASSCKTIKLPALPAAASGQNGHREEHLLLGLLFSSLIALVTLV